MKTTLNNPKVIVFDFDETLVPTHDLQMILEHDMCKSFGIPLQDEYFYAACAKRDFGLGMTIKEQMDFCNKTFYPLMNKLWLTDEYLKQIKFFDNMKKVIKELSMSGQYKLAIASARTAASIILFLEKEAMQPYFSPILGIDSGIEVKPSPHALQFIANHYNIPISKENFIMVGDAPDDINMGKAIGAATIGIGYGQTYETNKLEKLNPDHIVSNKSEIEQIPNIVKNMFERTK